MAKKVNIEDMTAEQLKAELAKYQAKEVEAEAKVSEEDKKIKDLLNSMEELVTIKLFKGQEEKYKQPLTVSLNGEVIMIQRGIEVQVKRKFAEVIRNHEEQTAYSVSLMEELQGDYAQAEHKLN